MPRLECPSVSAETPIGNLVLEVTPQLQRCYSEGGKGGARERAREKDWESEGIERERERDTQTGGLALGPEGFSPQTPSKQARHTDRDREREREREWGRSEAKKEQ